MPFIDSISIIAAVSDEKLNGSKELEPTDLVTINAFIKTSINPQSKMIMSVLSRLG